MMFWKLFITFFKVGIFTFGGGYAMLPLLERECVDNNHWISKEELLDYFAIGQCTPGIIAVNVATFVGNKKKGILGGIIATIGIAVPSIIVITLFASVLFIYKDNPLLLKAFSGIRLSVCALIFSSIIKLSKKSLTDFLCIVFAVLSLFAQLFFSINSIYIVLSTIVLSIIIYVQKREKIK